MMKSSEVQKECEMERDLLEITEQLIINDYVVYYIPTG